MTRTHPTPAPPATALTELPALRGMAIEHRLGYFRDDPIVLFGYCPGGGEVIWKDGHSSGFGTGGWRTYLWEIAPLAAQRGAFLGNMSAVGSHVLVLDRVAQRIYVGPRRDAEAFLAQAYDLQPFPRPCLCSGSACADCPMRAAGFCRGVDPAAAHPSTLDDIR